MRQSYKAQLRRRRCQAAPEAGGGGSLFNLRAWGAGVVSGLKLGQAEAPRGAPEDEDDEDDALPPPALLAPGEQSSWDEWQQVGVRRPSLTSCGRICCLTPLKASTAQTSPCTSWHWHQTLWRWQLQRAWLGDILQEEYPKP